MKPLLGFCLLSVFCLAVGAAQISDEPSVEFREFFIQHQQKGTLFDSQTAQYFEAKAWGTLYRDAVAQRFMGRPQGGLRLEVGVAQGYRPQVGKKIALRFRLHNE